MSSPLVDKSLDFAAEVVLFYEAFMKSKKGTTIAKQLLRSATSVGANINEAIYGNSKADFISKLHISLKEVGESTYGSTCSSEQIFLITIMINLHLLLMKSNVCLLLRLIRQKTINKATVFKR